MKKNSKGEVQISFNYDGTLNWILKLKSVLIGLKFLEKNSFR